MGELIRELYALGFTAPEIVRLIDMERPEGAHRVKLMTLRGELVVVERKITPSQSE